MPAKVNKAQGRHIKVEPKMAPQQFNFKPVPPTPPTTFREESTSATSGDTTKRSPLQSPTAASAFAATFISALTLEQSHREAAKAKLSDSSKLKPPAPIPPKPAFIPPTISKQNAGSNPQVAAGGAKAAAPKDHKSDPAKTNAAASSTGSPGLMMSIMNARVAPAKPAQTLMGKAPLKTSEQRDAGRRLRAEKLMSAGQSFLSADGSSSAAGLVPVQRDNIPMKLTIDFEDGQAATTDSQFSLS